MNTENHRIRKLIDGRYVPEVNLGWWIFSEWVGVCSLGYTWSRGGPFYNSCIVATEEQARKHLSAYGI